jgi:hypothetical protein
VTAFFDGICDLLFFRQHIYNIINDQNLFNIAHKENHWLVRIDNFINKVLFGVIKASTALSLSVLAALHFQYVILVIFYLLDIFDIKPTFVRKAIRFVKIILAKQSFTHIFVGLTCHNCRYACRLYKRSY